jgi:hypothetical protein
VSQPTAFSPNLPPRQRSFRKRPASRILRLNPLPAQNADKPLLLAWQTDFFQKTRPCSNPRWMLDWRKGTDRSCLRRPAIAQHANTVHPPLKPMPHSFARFLLQPMNPRSRLLRCHRSPQRKSIGVLGLPRRLSLRRLPHSMVFHLRNLRRPPSLHRHRTLLLLPCRPNPRPRKLFQVHPPRPRNFPRPTTPAR